MRDPYKNVSSSRKAVVDFCLKGLVGQKAFNDVYHYNRDVEGGQFIE